jgi:hypothetical protein
MKVFWILAPLLLGLALYLLWYTRRTRQLIAQFTGTHGLTYRKVDDGELGSALDAAFGLEGPGQIRTFGQIRDIVDTKDGIVLFRTVELLDLSAHGTSQSTHYSRVAVTYPASAEHDLFVLVGPNLECRSRFGGDSRVPESAVGVIRSSLDGWTPRCPMSLTLNKGRGVMYLEPLVTGAVRAEDLDYLVAAGRRLREAFT